MSDGRPSIFTPDIAEEICARLADGESLRAICLTEGMPSQRTVYYWLNTNEGFLQQYTRAREVQADTIFDEMLDISDDATNDWMERAEEKGGGYEINGEHIQRTRLRIETRKWMAGKLRPKKYGDKVEHEHSGNLNHTVTKIELVGISPE